MIHMIRKNRMCFIGFPLSLVFVNICGGVSKGVGEAPFAKILYHSLRGSVISQNKYERIMYQVVQKLERRRKRHHDM